MIDETKRQRQEQKVEKRDPPESIPPLLLPRPGMIASALRGDFERRIQALESQGASPSYIIQLLSRSHAVSDPNVFSKERSTVSYVRPRLDDGGSALDLAAARTRLLGLVERLEKTLGDDEVEVDAHYVSLKKAVAKTRAALRETAKESTRFRLYAVGVIHDSLAFTDSVDLSAEHVNALRNAITIAMKASIEKQQVRDVNEILQEGGFTTTPRPRSV